MKTKKNKREGNAEMRQVSAGLRDWWLIRWYIRFLYVAYYTLPLDSNTPLM